MMLLRVAGFGSNSIWAVGGGIQQEVARSTRLMWAITTRKPCSCQFDILQHACSGHCPASTFRRNCLEVRHLGRKRDVLSRFSEFHHLSLDLGIGSHSGNICDQRHAREFHHRRHGKELLVRSAFCLAKQNAEHKPALNASSLKRYITGERSQRIRAQE